jgi:hypothetical protein
MIHTFIQKFQEICLDNLELICQTLQSIVALYWIKSKSNKTAGKGKSNSHLHIFISKPLIWEPFKNWTARKSSNLKLKNWKMRTRPQKIHKVARTFDFLKRSQMTDTINLIFCKLGHQANLGERVKDIVRSWWPFCSAELSLCWY